MSSTTLFTGEACVDRAAPCWLLPAPQPANESRHMGTDCVCCSNAAESHSQYLDDSGKVDAEIHTARRAPNQSALCFAEHVLGIEFDDL